MNKTKLKKYNLITLESIRTFFLIFFDSFLRFLFKIIKKEKVQSFKTIFIRLDGIGDGILFINNINGSNKDDTLYIIGKRNGNFYKEIDNVKHHIEIDEEKFRKNVYYRFIILNQIRCIQSAIVINPLFSRSYTSDTLVNFLISNKKIGFKGDLINYNFNKFLSKLNNKHYNQLIDLEISEKIHELDINKKLFELINPSKFFDINSISFNSFYSKKINLNHENYVIIHVGGSQSLGINIETEFFIKIRDYLINHYNINIVLTGYSKKEKEIAKEIKNNYDKKITNYVGKLTIREVFSMVDSAKMIISIDTFIAHIAYMMDKKLIAFKKNNQVNVLLLEHGNFKYDKISIQTKIY